jgi:hypothetical protein
VTLAPNARSNDGGPKASRRLVQRVDDAEQVRPDLRRPTEPLQFAWRQRAAFERQITETEIEQHFEPSAQTLAAERENLKLTVAHSKRGCGR